jgi:TATA-binding protein-associated factor Taf7
MIQFPVSTIIHRRIPKEAFYKHLSLSPALKAKFVSDVDRIVVENSLTKENLNLEKDAKIKEIMLLSISLKKQSFDGKILEVIARQNPHKLVFALTYEDEVQLAVYYQKLYVSSWMKENEVKLSANGFSLDEIWENLIEQIALADQDAEKGKDKDLSLDERLFRQSKINELKKDIKKTESQMWKEVQPKKKFELHQKLQKMKKELEELISG